MNLEKLILFNGAEINDLSASIFYTGNLPPMGPTHFVQERDIYSREAWGLEPIKVRPFVEQNSWSYDSVKIKSIVPENFNFDIKPLTPWKEPGVQSWEIPKIDYGQDFNYLDDWKKNTFNPWEMPKIKEDNNSFIFSPQKNFNEMNNEFGVSTNNYGKFWRKEGVGNMKKNYSDLFNYLDNFEHQENYSTPNLIIRDLPNLGIQFHIHERGDKIEEAGFKKYGEDKQFEVLFPKKNNPYEVSMFDLYADKLGLKKIKK
ncbi:hypothetical protein HOD29_02055 [archaeon]|mgnify:FL=1|nr:hypothetical protein [archaeon]